jgi:hypothetical protein
MAMPFAVEQDYRLLKVGVGVGFSLFALLSIYNLMLS